jgi:hypothetical protein
MLMLKAIHALIKFLQGRKIYVCVFVIIVKMCCVELHKNAFIPKKIILGGPFQGIIGPLCMFQ